MRTTSHALPDPGATLGRARTALGDAIRILRKVSLRHSEAPENRHRLRLAEAQVFEARYHLASARSVLAVGLRLDEPRPLGAWLEPLAQVAAARRGIAALHAVHEAVGHELERRAVSTGRLDLLPLPEPLAAETISLPLAEALLFGAAASVALAATLWLMGAVGGAAGFLALGFAMWCGPAFGRSR